MRQACESRDTAVNRRHMQTQHTNATLSSGRGAVLEQLHTQHVQSTPEPVDEEHG
jgi:hypothetical protein